MKVLVTGATGFLGSWMTRYLVNQGLDVRVLRRKNSELSELQGLRIEHAIGDVTNSESLEKAFEDIDSVFHLAGVVGYSRAARPLMEKVNVGGTQNIIEACLEHSVRRLVHMSSVVAIGAAFPGQAPLNEDSEYNLAHLHLGYFDTKHAAEQVVHQAVRDSSLDAVILNPSTAYGPGDAKKGSRKMQLKVAQGRMPFYTSGGVSVISVDEVVKATFRAWKDAPKGERYILSGENILIKDLFRIIAEEAGVKPPSLMLPNFLVKSLGHVGDLLESFGSKGPINSENAWTSTLFHWFDSSKAQRELGLNPTSAREAIHQSISWSREQGLL
jgi:dihydroflavonol-4-reductase